MYEKVNPSHPDKVADRIAGAIVDLAYKQENNPKVAVEVLIGHGRCFVIIESSVTFVLPEIKRIVERITGDDEYIVKLVSVEQDSHLSQNQKEKIRCGDNGIFKGIPITDEQTRLTKLSQVIYDARRTDGKYILDGDEVVICQSYNPDEFSLDAVKRGVPSSSLKHFLICNGLIDEMAIVNPLGEWTGGPDVDTGATNRKLGSDMGDAVTGGGLHGKDLSKADVSVNIYAHLKAQETGKPVELSCAIGDEYVDGKPYSEIVEIARNYINSKGGFEKFAEWGLI